jgi:succinyl-CoA synthetase alpha subunit
MSILVGKHSKVVVQGITGSAGSFHTRQMIEYGTKVVAGVVPGRGGEKFDGVELYDTVADAVETTGADVSAVFVPAPFAADAILESAAAGVGLVVAITEGIPTLDMIRVREKLGGSRTRLIGPNCPGIITPGECKVGIMPGYIHKPGGVGVISRSGTLTYEAVHQLTRLGIGQSTCVGIGGDPVGGMSFVDLLALYAADPGTRAVVVIGEIGGNAEEQAARWMRDNFEKPAVAFVAGQTAPPGKRMGHAGAIVAGGRGTARDKIAALREAGIRVAPSPAEIGSTLAEVLK